MGSHAALHNSLQIFIEVFEQLCKAAWGPIYANGSCIFLNQLFYNKWPDDGLLLGRNM
jgi:hypothetical protein